MRCNRILGLSALGLLVMAQCAMTQRGGAARSGVRGAVVGDIVGGSEGAAKGAKIGVVTNVTRNAIDKESTARTQYQSTTQYQNAERSNFNEAPPEVLGVPAEGTAKKPTGEAVISKDGNPVVGITFPADWKQKTGENYVAAVSGDGQAYSMLAMLKGVEDKQAGIKKIKEAIETKLKDVKFDDPSETKSGAMLITGTGKGKKAGVEVVFAAGVFDAGKGQLVGAAFIVDAKIEDHYKETVRGICQTVRRAEDFKKD